MKISDIQFPKTLFVSGTGTDVGKSYATGWLAAELIKKGESCITQKFIQTGNIGYSEDIALHRKLMGINLLPIDRDFTTAPEIFSYPCSPELAARIDNRDIDFYKINDALKILQSMFSYVIIEGAGGLMVPLKGEYLTSHYIHDQNLPLLLVISGELGSINHALLTLNAVQTFHLNLFGVIYNPYFDKDPVICNDTRSYLQKWLSKHFVESVWIDMPGS